VQFIEKQFDAAPSQIITLGTLHHKAIRGIVNVLLFFNDQDCEDIFTRAF
jgi:hypothetical protein